MIKLKRTSFTSCFWDYFWRLRGTWNKFWKFLLVFGVRKRSDGLAWSRGVWGDCSSISSVSNLHYSLFLSFLLGEDAEKKPSFSSAYCPWWTMGGKQTLCSSLCTHQSSKRSWGYWSSPNGKGYLLTNLYFLNLLQSI